MAVLVENVKAPTPFADIESGIDTSFPSTNNEPADILVNDVREPDVIVPVAVIDPVDEIPPVLKLPPIATAPASVIDNLVVGVAPVRILKALVPFVWNDKGIFASLPCAIIELPLINNSAVASNF